MKDAVNLPGCVEFQSIRAISSAATFVLQNKRLMEQYLIKKIEVCPSKNYTYRLYSIHTQYFCHI